MLTLIRNLTQQSDEKDTFFEDKVNVDYSDHVYLPGINICVQYPAQESILVQFVQSLMITHVIAEKDETKNKPENQSVIPLNFILLRSWLF